MLLSEHSTRRVAQVGTDGLLQKAKVFLGDPLSIPALDHLARSLGLVQMRLVLCIEVNVLGQWVLLVDLLEILSKPGAMNTSQVFESQT